MDAKYLWGYIDPYGKVIIPYQFENAGIFCEGRAHVRIHDKKCYINNKGKVVIRLPEIPEVYYHPFEKWFESDDHFSEGLKAVQASEGLFGAIDGNGNWVISPKFTGLLDFSQGLAQATIDTERVKTGFINQNGDWVIPPQFLDASNFSEDLAAVQFTEEGKWGYIDRNGNVVISPRFESASPFSEGLAAVDEGSAFVDQEGHMVIQAQPGFHRFHPFSQGRASFNTSLEPDDGQVGFMDRTGKKIIPPQFRAVWSFSEGLAAVWLPHGKMGFIDLSGKLVIQPQFDSVNSFSEGFAEVLDESLPDGVTEEDDWHGVWGFINKTGKIVLKPQFATVQQFSEGLAPVKRFEYR